MRAPGARIPIVIWCVSVGPAKMTAKKLLVLQIADSICIKNVQDIFFL